MEISSNPTEVSVDVVEISARDQNEQTQTQTDQVVLNHSEPLDLPSTASDQKQADDICRKLILIYFVNDIW